MAKPALGRGLGALLGGVPLAPKTPPPPVESTPAAAPEPANDTQERIQRIALPRIRPCPLQPRKDFPADALRELADSIREQGIVQPLIVRPRGDGFELIAGERRWRAAQMLGLNEVPVIVREADDRAVLELALIENLQRENLNPLEEALGYAQLVDQFQLTQEIVAAKVGKSRAVVANAMRLLKLPPEMQNYVRDGRLSVGHAKVVLGLNRAEEQLLAADRIIRQGLNVRQTEDLVARLQNRGAVSPGGKTSGKTAAPLQDAHVMDLETRLQQRFGTKVVLRYRQGKGAVEIRFFTDDDLERVLEIVGVKVE
ncbi:MAG: ParB/RepB/Spo0J family partition protein [Verrucomicrobia bacterium]|nr:ParB/RepB/Spo0J family partition protein [Verrucomicrobiota bacterium]